MSDDTLLEAALRAAAERFEAMSGVSSGSPDLVTYEGEAAERSTRLLFFGTGVDFDELDQQLDGWAELATVHVAEIDPSAVHALFRGLFSQILLVGWYAGHSAPRSLA